MLSTMVSPPSPGTGVASWFADVLARVDMPAMVDRSADAGSLVSGLVELQQVKNHCDGRMVELVYVLYLTTRDRELAEYFDVTVEELYELAASDLDALDSLDQFDPSRWDESEGVADLDRSADNVRVDQNATANQDSTDQDTGDQTHQPHQHSTDQDETSQLSASRHTTSQQSCVSQDITTNHRADEQDSQHGADQQDGIQPSAGGGSSSSGGDAGNGSLEDPLFPLLIRMADSEDLDGVLRVEQAAFRATAAEVALALGWSPRSATNAVRRWLGWTRTPSLVRAMTDGRIEPDKAGAIAGATSVLRDNDPATGMPDPVRMRQAEGISAELVEQAPRSSLRQITDAADALVQQVDPEAAERRHRHRVADRRLVVQRNVDCTADLKVLDTPADLAAAGFNRVDALARRAKAAGDTRNLDQLRSDLALSLIAGTAQFYETDSATPGEPAEPGEPRQHSQPAEPSQPGQHSQPAERGAINTSPPERTEHDTSLRERTEQGDHAVAHQQRTDQPDRAAPDKPGEPGFTEDAPIHAAAAEESSVGCDCAPGGACHCECGTAYADPQERARLEVRASAAAGNTSHHASQRKSQLSEQEPSISPVFPVVPVAPGEVPGRASTLPDTILTVPLETVLGWINPPDPTNPETALPEATAPETALDSSSPADRTRPATQPPAPPPPPSAAKAATAVTGLETTSPETTTPEISRPGASRPARPTGPAPRAQTAAGTSPAAWLPQLAGLPPVWAERAGPLLHTIAYRVMTARLTRVENTRPGQPGEPAEFRIAVTDKQGRVVQYHAVHARTLRGLLREAVAVDYSTCLFPTCSTPAMRCQADHAIPYALVRATRESTVEPLCAADHAVKTAGGYRIERNNLDDPGSPATWRLAMPSGHVYALDHTILTYAIRNLRGQGVDGARSATRLARLARQSRRQPDPADGAAPPIAPS